MRSNNKSDDDIAEFLNIIKMKFINMNLILHLDGIFISMVRTKIILLERYISDEGSKIHAANISPGGPLENEFPKFMDHFVIEVQNYVRRLKEIQSNFPIPFSYYSLIAGYSR